MIRATRWISLLSTLGGAILAITGPPPLFVDSGGERLAGLGHPAFLAGVCLAAIYGCLIRLYRGGRRDDLALLLVNVAILTLTGARATGLRPCRHDHNACVLLSTVHARPAAWLLLIGAATLLPVLVLLDHSLTDIRLFNVLTAYTTDLSGQELLWPLFERAANQSCWLGWGLGAGNFIISPDSEVAKLLQTWAAHNEYLRMEVEGGSARAWPAGGGLRIVGGPP
jgi:hypothetical protein